MSEGTAEENGRWKESVSGSDALCSEECKFGMWNADPWSEEQ